MRENTSLGNCDMKITMFFHRRLPNFALPLHSFRGGGECLVFLPIPRGDANVTPQALPQ